MELALTFLIVATAQAAIAAPEWTKRQSQVLTGGTYKVVCSGQGPAIDIARTEAMQSCKASATQMLQRETKVRSLSVETENNISFHQLIEENATYKNLTCAPEREEIEDHNDGSITVWMLCKFNLNIAEVGKDTADEVKNNTNSGSVQDSSLTKITEKAIRPASKSVQSKIISSLDIMTIPPCSEILIRGPRPRAQKCTTNPMQIVVYQGDEDLLVRSNGYISKTINLKSKNWGDHESVQVILEK